MPPCEPRARHFLRQNAGQNKAKLRKNAQTQGEARSAEHDSRAKGFARGQGESLRLRGMVNRLAWPQVRWVSTAQLHVVEPRFPLMQPSYLRFFFFWPSPLRGQVLSLLAAPALSLCMPHSALAGPAEAPVEIAINTAKPDQWFVRYDQSGGGLILSENAGTSWQLSCNDALDGELTRETTRIAAAANGDLFIGTYRGLWRVTDGGCRATKVTDFGDSWVSDIVGDPRDPNLLYAATATSGEDNGLMRYDAATDAWVALGAREPLTIQRLAVAPRATGRRLYESIPGYEAGVDPETGAQTQRRFTTVRYSDDDGQSWTDFRGFESSVGVVAIEAVDPSQPERIVLSETFPPSYPLMDRVWLNDAAGRSEASRMLGEVDGFGGAAFGPAGQLWFADKSGALYQLLAGDTDPAPLAPDIRARCLTFDQHRSTLLACQAFTVSAIAEDGSAQPVLDLRAIDDWRQCGALDVPAACQARLGSGRDGWCSYGHYPEAGICRAFCEGEGGAVATPDVCTAIAMAEPPVETPEPATQPMPMQPSGPASAASPAADAGPPPAEASPSDESPPGVAVTGQSEGSAGGCAIPSGAHPPRARWATALSLCALLMGLRRRRARRG